MYPSLILSAALLAPAAPVPRDTAPNTAGPAPRVLALKADASGTVRVVGSTPVKVTVTNTHFVIETVVVNGQQVQQQVQKQVEQDIVTTQYVNKTLAEFNGKFATAEGTPLTLEEATSRLKNGATLLASSDGKPIAKAWLRAVSPDTVVLVADGLSHVQPQWGGGTLATTPAPRLAMLGTDDSGKLMTACTSAPLNPNGAVYYDDFAEFGGRGGFRGKAIRGDVYYPNQPQTEGKVILKPLADVKFDAYDLTGKLVPRGEALKRLAAGGLVLVAGDNRLPDENYTKAFREDVLILVGAELVLPVTPIDQTRKKEPVKEADPKVQPVPPAVKPLPAVQPAIQPLPAVRPAVIRGRAAVLPAAAVEEKVEAKPVEKK